MAGVLGEDMYESREEIIGIVDAFCSELVAGLEANRTPGGGPDPEVGDGATATKVRYAIDLSLARDFS